MDRVTCRNKDLRIDDFCPVHDELVERRFCNLNGLDHEGSFCRCCLDYLAFTDSVKAGYCRTCRLNPDHQRPVQATARSIWNA